MELGYSVSVDNYAVDICAQRGVLTSDKMVKYARDKSGPSNHLIFTYRALIGVDNVRGEWLWRAPGGVKVTAHRVISDQLWHRGGIEGIKLA